MFADVILTKGQIDRPITYSIPPHLSLAADVGKEARVPLGNTVTSAYILSVFENSSVKNVKEILDIKVDDPLFTKAQAEIVKFLVDYYISTYLDAIKLCVVDNKNFSANSFIAIEKVYFTDKTLEHIQHYICESDTPVKSAKLREVFGARSSVYIADLIRSKAVIPLYGKSSSREVNLVDLIVDTDYAEILQNLSKNAKQQSKLIEYISENNDAFPLSVRELSDLSGLSDSVVRSAVKKGYLRIVHTFLRRNPWESVDEKNVIPPKLTEAQKTAVEQITNRAKNGWSESFLVYGVTGSGKTEIFLHSIDEVIKAGKQVIVLVPEISLTAQAMALFYGRFGDRVAILHSNLSEGERFDEWQRIKSGQAVVVLGARSAIFAPVNDLGLIIIDEEHEGSYKQEKSPRYNAKTVGEFLSVYYSCPLVLASATPSLESMAKAKGGNYTLISLPSRIENRPMPKVKVVDLRKMTKNGRILSHPLKEAIYDRLQSNEQTIIFLNRRGYSHSLLCTGCGGFAVCPHCNVPLTYHKNKNLLRCHHCDYAVTAKLKCEVCGGENIAYKGVGTERLEADISTEFPTARIARLDRDTTSKKGAHREIFEKFSRREIDILIGTQMVAKGFDFPFVTLVGVVAADTTLGVSDFRSPERTFQLLTQVAGRAGRANLSGEVYIQTFQPEHYAISAASKHDYDEFFDREYPLRKEIGWPPLNSIANVIISGENENIVRLQAYNLRELFKEKNISKLVNQNADTHSLTLFDDILGFSAKSSEEKPEEKSAKMNLKSETINKEVYSFDDLYISDPVPCNLAKLKNKYRYHIIFRGDISDILRALNIIKGKAASKDVQVAIDVDPMSIL